MHSFKKQDPGLIILNSVSVTIGSAQVLSNINLTIQRGQQWAITGDAGSGKTTLAHVLNGSVSFSGDLTRYFADATNARIELVEQQHHFKNLRNTSNFYYQQRFNASEAGDSITVAGALEAFPDKEKWLEVLHLQPLLDKPLLQLSNGENKRLQLAKALLANPGVLILDNPFIGLDTEGRKTLHEILDSLVLKDIQVILITGATELPACITNVAVLKKGRLIFAGSRQAYLQQPVLEIAKPVPDRTLLQQLKQPAAEFFNVVVSMHDVTIRYGNKTVLNKINWLVKQGECWNVSGPNGAGKSTLLSLITADNPQAYANKIILFDKQRGTGESIWDIKKRIGFVSPELHLYFEQHATCFEVIASGLFDTIGLFRRLSAEQEERLIFWMRLMGLESIQHKRLNQISTSEQRMALLARALVKNPALLILDEPTQGLDETQAAYFKKLVNEICNSFSTTLIYVSHYTSDLPACIDHFLKLAEGNVQD